MTYFNFQFMMKIFIVLASFDSSFDEAYSFSSSFSVKKEKYVILVLELESE